MIQKQMIAIAINFISSKNTDDIIPLIKDG